MSSRTDSLSTKQWARLQAIFDQAMELPPEQRAALLDAKCDGDARIRQQVEALIIAADADEELVGDLIRTAADQVLEQNTKTRSRIGSFRIVDVIGTGGMGMVYLGQRIDEEYQQQVAIKILHDGLESDEAMLRFKTERQILADLNHPNIAKLLDGGKTDDGLPYLVMEYIDGTPLVTYCDQRRLTIDERLDLFKQVCSAVAAAHRSLVVHRDLKPSNILVDSQGVPKLLDFGIAKVLKDGYEQGDLAKTQLGDRLLTPDYASPEQVQGRAVTTSSDIYSLGVVLYQLLCGTRPFKLADKTPAEMEKIISHEVVAAPSKAVGTLKDRGSSAQAIAADRRNTTADRLARKIRGELDHIVLMALKKEPERRYQSVSQFAADIDRFQRGQPIIAAKDTHLYQARKFVQRNRIAVAAAATLLVALIGFSVASFQQAQAIAKERDVSESALDFLEDVFEASNPGELQKEVVTAIDILDVGAARIEEQLKNQPEARARLQRIIGLAYSNNGKIDESYANLESSLSAYVEVYGKDHPFPADLEQNLGWYWRDKGNYDRAMPHFERALAIYQNGISKRFFRDDPAKGVHAIVVAMVDVADIQYSQGQYGPAEEQLLEALPLSRRVNADPRYQRIEVRILKDLAEVQYRVGHFDQGDDYLQQALALVDERYDGKELERGWFIGRVASIKHGLNHLDEAENYYREALALIDGKVSPSSPRAQHLRSRYGRLLRDQQRLEEALPILLEIEQNIRAYYGDRVPYDAAKELVELGRVQMGMGLLTDAERTLNDAVDIYLRTAGKRNNWALEALREQANLSVLMGRPDEALARFDDTVDVLMDLYGLQHWQTVATMSEQAEAHIALGNYEQAVELLQTSMPVLEKILGNQHRLYLAANERLERARARGAALTGARAAEF